MGDFTTYGTSQTQLTFTRQGTVCTNALDIEYYVTTFTTEATVQRGIATTTNATSTNVSLSPSVNIITSFPLISLLTDGGNYDGNDWIIPSFTNLSGNNASTLNLVQNNSSATLSKVAWQVVTYANASVQSGTATISSGSTSTTAAITSVTLSKSWLVYYSKYNASGLFNAADQTTEGNFSNSSQLTFAKGNSTTTVPIQWFVISFTDSTTVQSGNISLSTSATSGTSTITSIDTTLSIINAGGLYGRGGQSTNGGNSDVYNAQGTLDITNSTTVTFTRGITESHTASLTWFVVQFAPPPTPTPTPVPQSYNGSMANTQYTLHFANLNSFAGQSAGSGFKLGETGGQTGPGVFTSGSGQNFTVRSGFQYIKSIIPFAFSISSTNINFGTLSATNPVTRTNTITISNNSAYGYSIVAFENHQLSNPAKGYLIPNTTCDNGTCTETTSALWTSNLTYGFGYRCDNLSGSDCSTGFSIANYYKQLADISAGKFAQTIMSGTIARKNQGQITYKANISSIQPPGLYTNNITFIAAPKY